MTFFGVIWLELLLCCFFVPDISCLVGLTIVSSVFQCSHVALVGNAAIGPQVITSAAFALKMFLTTRKRIRLQKDAVALQFGALFVFLMALLSTLLNETLKGNYSRLLQLLTYTVCFLYMFRAGKFIRADFCDKLLRRLTAFLAVVGFAQFLITSGVLPRTLFMQELFYNDAYVDNVVYYSQDHYFRVLSTYMEPSYYAPFLVGAFFYFLNDKSSMKRNEFLLFILALQILLTFSSTAYGATFVMMTFFLFSRAGNKKYKGSIIAIGIIGCFPMFCVLFPVMDAVIFSKRSSGSWAARHYFNINAYSAFLNSPIFGVGYKQTRGSSLYFSLLGQLGLVGFGAYLMIMVPIVRLLFSKKAGKRVKRQYVGLCFAVLSVTVCQMIAIPDLDICSYWMWMNLLALSYHSRQRRRGVIGGYA